MEGVLRSWAVPKGPSYDTADKRLAVLVEDHPLEYGDFEGLIPEGNYGAGAVIVWDRGQWVPIGDPLEGLAKGKLLFELRGYKLQRALDAGEAQEGREGVAPHQGARRVGVAPEPRAAGRVGALRADGARSSRRERIVAPRSAASSCGSARPAGRSTPKAGGPDAGGDRRAARSPGRAGCSSRSSTATGCWPPAPRRERAPAHAATANDCTGAFPEMARAVAALPFERLLLDGEVVALDERGAAELPAAAEPGPAAPADRHPARDGRDAGHLLRLRPARLRGLRSAAAPAHREEVGAPARAAAGRARSATWSTWRRTARRCTRRPSGSGSRVSSARRPRAPYKAGRSPVWLKVRSRRTGDFVVVGLHRRPRDRAAASARCTWPTTWTAR